MNSYMRRWEQVAKELSEASEAEALRVRQEAEARGHWPVTRDQEDLLRSFGVTLRPGAARAEAEAVIYEMLCGQCG